jgi:hypothetical protein
LLLPAKVKDAPARAFHLEQTVAAGYRVDRQRFEVAGGPRDNLEAELPGTCEPGLVIVGAHYDAVPACAGADDNGSGVAAMLALARAFAGRRSVQRDVGGDDAHGVLALAAGHAERAGAPSPAQVAIDLFAPRPSAEDTARAILGAPPR